MPIISSVDFNPRTWDFLRAVYTVRSADSAWQLSFSRASIPNARCASGSPFPNPWSIITAWNPQGRNCDEASNIRRQREFERRMRESGLQTLPSINCSPEGDWPEPGLLIFGMGRTDALSLARHFQQLAVIYASDGRTGLLDCRTERLIVRSVFARTTDALPLQPPCRGSERSWDQT